MINSITPLNYKDCIRLSEILGDTPETAISIHLLKKGLCWAYIYGELPNYDVAIIQSKLDPTEPTGYGYDPKAIWKILRLLKGWNCIEVSSECANELGNIILSEKGGKIRYYEDIYHILPEPAKEFKNDFVRQISLDDLNLLESADEDFRKCGFSDPKSLLTEGFSACAIVSGEIVGIALTSARSEKYSDIGVFVSEKYRNLGFASASASIIARLVQESGQIPIWSAGEDNISSLRVARKLGFIEILRKVYVIPKWR